MVGTFVITANRCHLKTSNNKMFSKKHEDVMNEKIDFYN